MSHLLVYVPLVAALAAVVGLVLQWQRNRTLHDRLGEMSDELRDVRAQLAAQAPRPEVAIHGLRPLGGDAVNVQFGAGVVNRGLKPTHATIEASVAGEVIYTRQGVNLLANERHVPVHLEVARPRLGDLVPALGDATTLYGETLTVTVMPLDGDPATALVRRARACAVPAPRQTSGPRTQPTLLGAPDMGR